MRYTFKRGDWSDGADLPEWADHEELSAYLERIGFASAKQSFGDEHGALIEIYESSTHNSYLAEVCPAGSTVFHVLLPDFPSFMMFVREYAAPFSLAAIDSKHHELRELTEKLFRVLHGHEPTAMCSTCDPRGFAAAAAAREGRSTKSQTG